MDCEKVNKKFLNDFLDSDSEASIFTWLSCVYIIILGSVKYLGKICEKTVLICILRPDRLCMALQF